ncbi:hypothetical protein HU200_023645 [Digitaria exilis]|uniref:Glabrous enhancer-binding protein-like DBD domain-containing protein n=1 Tax=Digitaria exilis TaxID=1010633 RepID=A0A835C2Q9_9POAL|nr:hypothetical protein HU200_023645 [Digitaria exilis]CAB3499772.1 unnamed protein product [Digitaria exilis]
MAPKRRSRRRISERSEDLGLDGAKKSAKTIPAEVSDEEEGDNSGDARAVRHAPATAAPKPKGTPGRAKKLPSLSTEDAGAGGSGEASQARGAPNEELDAAAPPPLKKSKTKKTTTKRAKRHPPPSEEEDEAESGDRKAPADEATAVSPRRKIVASPRHRRDSAPARKRAKRGASRPFATRVEQGHAGNTSPPQMEDDTEEAPQMEDDTEEEEQEVAEHAENTSLPQQKDGAHEDGDMGVEVSDEALPERSASSPKISSSEGEKKPAVGRSWSQADELKILTTLVEHARSQGGALPDSTDLVANLTFDKTDANADKLSDKIRKLRARYHKLSSKGRPTDDIGSRLFDLSVVLWGQDDDDVQVEETFVTGDRDFTQQGDRDFTQQSSLYPYLAEEVKVYAEKHSSGHLILAAFPTIGDDTSRQLDAMCKKQRLDAFKLELNQANLTKALLSAVSSHIN